LYFETIITKGEKVQEKWSAYSITWILYLGILLLPFGFYYTYSQLQTVKSSTEVVRRLGRSGGDMLLLTMRGDKSGLQQKNKEIDKTLKELRGWFVAHNNDIFYVGVHSLLEDYDEMVACWGRLKKNTTQSAAL